MQTHCVLRRLVLSAVGCVLLVRCFLMQVVSKKVAAVKYLIEDLLSSFPQLDGHAGDGAADGPQPMQLDS